MHDHFFFIVPCVGKFDVICVLIQIFSIATCTLCCNGQDLKFCGQGLNSPSRSFELVVTSKILDPIYKCCILLNCITYLHIGNLKLKHLYKLGACFFPLTCVSESHKVPLPIQKSLPNCHFYACSLAKCITLFFWASSYMGIASTHALPLML